MTQRLLHLLPPETAHKAALGALKMGLAPRRAVNDAVLQTRVFGIDFKNPLGLAAGFDKDAEVLAPMLRMGFGFAEAGTVTPRPQPGNPRPRVFRDAKTGSVINRMGFPGGGLEPFVANLRQFRARHEGVVGANIGMNKDSTAPEDDYRRCIDAVAPLADYIVINVSSPNTAGVRALQAREKLDALLSAVQSPVPLLLKVSPDLDASARADIAELAEKHRLSGLIVSNTTTARPDMLPARLKREAGGLSGRLLKQAALDSLDDFYALTGGRMPLVGVGGISSADDAYERIRAGASLVQLYTALVFGGAPLVARILEGLAQRLRTDGFSSIEAAVGAGHRARGAVGLSHAE